VRRLLLKEGGHSFHHLVLTICAAESSVKFGVFIFFPTTGYFKLIVSAHKKIILGTGLEKVTWNAFLKS